MDNFVERLWQVQKTSADLKLWKMQSPLRGVWRKNPLISALYIFFFRGAWDSFYKVSILRKTVLAFVRICRLAALIERCKEYLHCKRAAAPA